MTRNDDTEDTRTGESQELSPEQLRALQYGVAAIIMPVTEGWKLHYFSIPDFEAEPGTIFPSWETAMEALEDALLYINSPESRARAREELREHMRRAPDDEAP